MRFRLLLGVLIGLGAHAQTYSTNNDEQLAEYIGRALDRNPAVQSSFARYRASLQRLPQVSALPDPTIGLMQYLRTPETRVGPQTTGLSIQQRFPWFGKLSDQEKLAAKEAAVMAAAHEADKAETVRRVKLAYYDLAYVDRAVALNEQELELLRHYETLAEARYAQGIGLQQAVVKLQAEITRGLNRIETLRLRRVDAEVALNLLTDRPAGEPTPPVALASPPTARVDAATLADSARRNRPEILAAFLRIEGDEKRIHLARKQRLPDVTVGAGFVNVLGRRDPLGREFPPSGNGKNIYNLTVGMNLPIFRRKYDAGVLEASELLIASKQRYREQVNEAEAAIRSAGFRMEAIKRQMALFETTLVAQAEQALRSSEDAYATGAIGAVELLDSERVLLDVRLGLAQLQSDYMKALAEMERAVGAAFPEETP